MKKYEFVFNAKKDDVLDSIMNGVVKAEFFQSIKLFEKQVLYGRVSKNKKHICLYHGTPYKNYLRPIFSAKVTEQSGTTKVTGMWRFSVRVIILFIIWYLTLLSFAMVPLTVGGEGNLLLLYIVLLVFSLFGILIGALGFKIERKRMLKVIEHIETVRFKLNNGF